MTSRLARFALVFLAAALLAGASRPAAAQTGPTVDDWSKLSWRWIGPVNFSGRITEFAAPRGQTTTFYVLTASGGLWKTEDAGIHFEPIFDRFGSMSLGYLAIAPSDPKILYLGTGEPMHARSSTHGDGVWKSVDAGKTWTRVGLERSFFIPKVAVDPKSPDVVYVAAEGKLYDNAMDCERGLYKTTDGGKTWTNVFPVKDRGVADFVVDPRDANVVIAAAYKTYRRAWTYIDRHEGNSLYKTTDGGATWKPLTQGLPVGAKLGRTGLVLQEKNPSIVYARLDEGVNLGLAERDGAANFRAGGFGGRGGGLLAEGWTISKLKGYKIPAELAKQAPKLPSFAAETEADLVKKLNEFIADKDALAKAGIDLARLNAAARKTHAKSKSLTAAIDEVEALQRREAPKADSSEAKGRAQILNRHALEMLYGGVLANQQPVKRNGVVYRSDDLGETWKRMTEYKTSGGSAQVNQTEGGYYGRIYVDPDDNQVVYCPDTNVTMSLKDHVQGRRQDLRRGPLGQRQLQAPRGSSRPVGRPGQRPAHHERQRRRGGRVLGRRQALAPEVDDLRPAVLRCGRRQRAALQRHGRDPGQRGLDRSQPEPQPVGRLRQRLDLPAHRRRVLCRPRLVEPRVDLLREPVRRLQPDEPPDRREPVAGQADDAGGGGDRRSSPALPVERSDRPLAPQPRHRLHLLPVRPPLPEPRRARHLRHHQPRPEQGGQGQAGRGQGDQPPVGHRLHLRRVGQEAGPLLGRHRRRQPVDVAGLRRHLGQHHRQVL
jgi:photosystem II stability/assembly factor-like uncharacterized protein